MLLHTTDDDDVSPAAVVTCHSDDDAVAIDDVNSDVSDYETNDVDRDDGVASSLSLDEHDERPLSGVAVLDCSETLVTILWTRNVVQSRLLPPYVTTTTLPGHQRST